FRHWGQEGRARHCLLHRRSRQENRPSLQALVAAGGGSLLTWCGSNLFHSFQKRLRPSRSDGGSCEKGAPSSGEKIVSSVVRGRRRRCAEPALELLNEHSIFPGRYRVVRWHGKERSSRLRPLNVRQRVSRFAAPRIGPLAHD